MSVTRTVYGVRARKSAKVAWERVHTLKNPKGQWSLRRDAQAELDKLKLRGYMGAVVVIKLRKVTGQPSVAKWLHGNVVPISAVAPEHRADYRDTLYRAARAAKQYGKPIQINSSYRPMAEQKRLYKQNMISPGVPKPDHALTAVPGTSDHGRGLALDIQNGRNIAKLDAALNSEGLGDNVASEAWHYVNLTAKARH